MKMCAKCGGSMKKGGATKKMAKGGVQKIVGMPGYNATLYPTSFKKGGVKKMQNGGEKPDKSVLKNILGLIGGGSGILAGTILGNREKDSEKANERDNKRIQRKSDRREKKGYKPISGPSFKNGGAKKSLPKAQNGLVGSNAQEISSKLKKPQYTINPYTLKEANAPGTESNTPIKRNIKKDIRNATRYIKKEARVDRQNDRKNARGVQKEFKPISEPSFKNGGTSFGMLSVKAGVDKNPKPTAADRIAGAKMKKKMGGSTKKK
jgi:hypothetical protein